MKKLTSQRLRLGVFVLVGTMALVIGLYYIGQQRNIFHSTILLHADFKNVDGLMPGNNVRFNGFDVGTVRSLKPGSDTTIHVEFSVAEDFVPLISVNSIASIGTDGLLGNKLLNLQPGYYFERAVQEMDGLQTRELVAMDAAMRTLNETNDNLLVLSRELVGVSQRLSADNSLWRLLADTMLSDHVRTALVKIGIVTENSAILSGDLRAIASAVRNGEGDLGALITDTSVYAGLRQTVVKLNVIGDTLIVASGNFKELSVAAASGDGLVAALLTDTMLVHEINRAVDSFSDAAEGLNSDLELLNQSRLFKRYKKRQMKHHN
jgi:phospholipid/cholesterol/gamma-HCH transport system substrate-binding protein